MTRKPIIERTNVFYWRTEPKISNRLRQYRLPLRTNNVNMEMNRYFQTQIRRQLIAFRILPCTGERASVRRVDEIGYHNSKKNRFFSHRVNLIPRSPKIATN